MKKAAVMGVILLFVGISIAPSISGSIGELSTASPIEEVSDISFKLKKTNENDIAGYDEPAVFGAGNSFSRTIYVDDDSAPDFTLTDIHGINFTLSDNAGKVVLINFMATWSNPCYHQILELVMVYENFSRLDLEMISVDIDIHETAQQLQGYIEDIEEDGYEVNWTFAIDTAEENVGDKYQVDCIPTIVIVDRRGHVSYRHQGVILADELITEIEKAKHVTIYVDDDNTEGPWDGTQEHPYQYIQDGIDNASEEDTIFVYNGIYKNNISIGGRPIGNESIIHSNINIIGQDKDSTIIEGARFKLIWCSFIKIKGFTIKNADIGIDLWSCAYIIITGCKITNNNYGLLLEMSGNTLIYENVIDSNNECAIEFRSILTWGYCEHNEIAINQISNNQIGIHLYGSSYLNKINYNNFYDNNLDAYNDASLLNNWNYNYWGDARILPKLIPGYYFIGGIDWHPAKEPYDIP
ncbi:MAG: redoxin domain-containing protein [Bacteroidales bacterium]|nr:redoxin domain-containing protein [Bacteroidales bacterium]